MFDQDKVHEIRKQLYGVRGNYRGVPTTIFQVNALYLTNYSVDTKNKMQVIRIIYIYNNINTNKNKITKPRILQDFALFVISITRPFKYNTRFHILTRSNKRLLEILLIV